jgi:hypothetical protein
MRPLPRYRMKKSTIAVAAVIVGVGWIGFLLATRRDDAAPRIVANPEPVTPPPAKSAEAAPSAANTLPVSSEVRGLLAAFEAALNRANVRAREALLTFKDEAGLRRFLDRAGKSGLEILGQLDGLNSVRVRYGRFDALQNELLQNAADYAAVSANYLVNIPQAPAKEDRAAVDQVPFRNDTLAFVGVPADHSTWGRGTTIAILDTGIAADPTFGSGRVRPLDIGLGTMPGRGAEDGHGTAVAALAAGLAADAPGVAPAANLLSIRVTDATGTSDIFTLSQGIVAAVNAGAQVINVSLGGYATSTALDAALAYATNHGAVVVAAAGNDQAAQLSWPAADPRVISVGAVDKAGQQVSFSNSGPQLQLAAPGYGVQTAWLDGQRAYVDGTSASAPIVAGAIAAVMAQNPSLTAQQAAQLLTKTASDAGAPGADASYGNGILNLAWAMNANTPGYVDTAISSHYFDAENNQMDFVVQNRSSQPVSGLTLNVTSGATASTYAVPPLAPGASYVVKTAVDSAALKANGSLAFATQLTNPSGLDDKVLQNNRKSSVLTAPVTR